MEHVRNCSRRRLLGGSAALGIGVPLLAACGGDEGGGAEAPEAGTVLVKTSEVPVGGGVILEGVVVTQPEEGTFKAFSSTCTHQSCTVTSVDETIRCSCHGSSFALSNGAVEGGPAPEPLPEVAIRVEGGEVISG